MLNEVQQNEIIKLYHEYQSEVKLMVYYVERRFHKFPIALLNNLRDVFDHISRCYEKDVNDEYIEDNIRKAQNHFMRIKLDMYKYIYDVKDRDFSRWKKKYSKYDLQNIEHGKFWKKILELEQESEILFKNAKTMESKNTSQSYELFAQAIKKYEEIDNEIQKKKQYIVDAKWLYRRVTLFSRLWGIVLGILTSLLASVLFETYFQTIKDYIRSLFN